MRAGTCSGGGLLLPAFDSAGTTGDAEDVLSLSVSAGTRFSRRTTCGSSALGDKAAPGRGESPWEPPVKLPLCIAGVPLGLSGGACLRCWLLSLLNVREMGAVERLKAAAGSSASCDDAMERPWTWRYAHPRWDRVGAVLKGRHVHLRGVHATGEHIAPRARTCARVEGSTDPVHVRKATHSSSCSSSALVVLKNAST